MASIAQKSLFCWEDIEELGDLKRLELVMSHIGDEELMVELEKERGLKGRRDYPIRAIWNSLLAKEVFQHKSIESLRRELRRNAQLRQVCGFDVVAGERAVAPAWVYSRFLKKLMKHKEMLVDICVELDRKLREVLPGYGKNLAMDGKAIQTHARYHGKGDRDRSRDGRRDTDADIDIRNCWNDGEETRLLPGTENIVYDYKGRVYCQPMGPGSEGQREMAYAGFEESRQALKYRCPAKHYGLRCSCSAKCKASKGIRIKIEQDPRLFTPVARSSYKWERIYGTRTAVERVNCRIDVCYGYEDHYIRGLAKMKMSISITVATMLAMALGRVRENPSTSRAQTQSLLEKQRQRKWLTSTLN